MQVERGATPPRSSEKCFVGCGLKGETHPGGPWRENRVEAAPEANPSV